MKDNLSLIAAAAGGFMLSIAASGIIKAAPITSLNTPPNLNSTQISNLQTSATRGPAHATGSSAPLRFKKVT